MHPYDLVAIPTTCNLNFLKCQSARPGAPGWPWFEWSLVQAHLELKVKLRASKQKLEGTL